MRRKAHQIPSPSSLDLGGVVQGKNKIPIYNVRLVRERTARFDHLPAIEDAHAAAQIARELLQDADREHFLVLMVNCQNEIIGLHTASVGVLNQALIGPREVFRAAILANAASIIVAHNHPSGSSQPSEEDLAVTRKLRQVGELLDIPVLDHVIVGPREGFTSLRRLGHFGERPSGPQI